MRSIPVAEARSHLFRLVEKASSTQERFVITRNGSRAAVLLGADDYDSLMETVAVLSDGKVVEALQRGVKELESGEVFSAGQVKAELRRRPSEILAEHRVEAWEIARKHKVRNVRVFGSAARGVDTPASDIDLLVDLDPGATLFDLASFRLDLVDLLGVEVDVVQSGSRAPSWTESCPKPSLCDQRL